MEKEFKQSSSSSESNISATSSFPNLAESAWKGNNPACKYQIFDDVNLNETGNIEVGRSKNMIYTDQNLLKQHQVEALNQYVQNSTPKTDLGCDEYDGNNPLFWSVDLDNQEANTRLNNQDDIENCLFLSSRKYENEDADNIEATDDPMERLRKHNLVSTEPLNPFYGEFYSDTDNSWDYYDEVFDEYDDVSDTESDVSFPGTSTTLQRRVKMSIGHDRGETNAPPKMQPSELILNGKITDSRINTLDMKMSTNQSNDLQKFIKIQIENREVHSIDGEASMDECLNKFTEETRRPISRLAVIADGIDPFASDHDLIVGDDQAVHNENDHLNFEKQGPRSVFGQLNYAKNWDTGSERHTDTSFYDETPQRNKASIQCQTLPSQNHFDTQTDRPEVIQVSDVGVGIEPLRTPTPPVEAKVPTPEPVVEVWPTPPVSTVSSIPPAPMDPLIRLQLLRGDFILDEDRIPVKVDPKILDSRDNSLSGESNFLPFFKDKYECATLEKQATQVISKMFDNLMEDENIPIVAETIRKIEENNFGSFNWSYLMYQK